MYVNFTHGKESGPWGSKIKALAEVAIEKGFEVTSHDYSDLESPDSRVERLLELHKTKSDFVVLVGSSMGGYVSTVASATIKPVGLFLLAPAFQLQGYAVQKPVPHADRIAVIHGLHDDVVPYENSIRFAREFATELHLLDSDHRLKDQIPKLKMLFGFFLDELMESRAAGKL